MWLLILLILVIGAVTGTLGTILEVAAGVVLGLVLFVVGVVAASYYYLRHRFRRAVREWERAEGRSRPGPSGGRLPPGGPDII
jgi:hypothetical protein